MSLKNNSSLKSIVDSIAEKHGISKGEAALMWQSMGNFIENTIVNDNTFPEEETFKSVYLYNFGTFYPKKPNIKKIKEKLNGNTGKLCGE